MSSIKCRLVGVPNFLFQALFVGVPYFRTVFSYFCGCAELSQFRGCPELYSAGVLNLVTQLGATKGIVAFGKTVVAPQVTTHD